MQKSYSVSPNLTMQMPSQKIAAEKLASIHRSREHLLTWLPWVYFYDHDAEKALAEYTDKKIKEFNDGTAFIFDIIHDNHFAGSIELLKIVPEDRRCEIGYWLDVNATGKGIMTKCVEKITALAARELNIHRVQIRAASDNKASRAVAERAGYQFEATLHDYQLLEGKFHDIVVYTKML